LSKRITVDPITRIEGHLRIDVEINDEGLVSKSWSSGQMWRGIENILIGRDPKEAWTYTQRFCGVCTTIHAITSVRAVEDALKLEIPLNAHLVRNIIQAAHALQDHIVHFYHLSAVDWVDVVSALDADPVATSKLAESLSGWSLNGPHEMKAVQERLKTFVSSGQLGPFASGYWGHPAMKLPPEVNLMAVAHYLQALDVQQYANKIVAILGGKTPHIQNVAVGGISNSISHDAPSVLNIERLMLIEGFIDKLDHFVKTAYMTDVPAIGAFYLDWTGYGKGVTNYLSVPDCPTDTKLSTLNCPVVILKMVTYRPLKVSTTGMMNILEMVLLKVLNMLGMKVMRLCILIREQPILNILIFRMMDNTHGLKHQLFTMNVQKSAH